MGEPQTPCSFAGDVQKRQLEAQKADLPSPGGCGAPVGQIMVESTECQ